MKNRKLEAIETVRDVPCEWEQDPRQEAIAATTVLAKGSSRTSRLGTSWTLNRPSLPCPSGKAPGRNSRCVFHCHHPSQQDSWSIKAVLPAACPQLKYSDLDGVKDGGGWLWWLMLRQLPRNRQQSGGRRFGGSCWFIASWIHWH